MSPYEGELPLQLFTTIVPLIFAFVVFFFIMVRLGLEFRQKRKIFAEKPDPQGFTEYPDVQTAVDGLYLKRKELRILIRNHTAYSHRLLTMILDDFERALDRGVLTAHNLLEEQEEGAAHKAQEALEEEQNRLIALIDAIKADEKEPLSRDKILSLLDLEPSSPEGGA